MYHFLQILCSFCEAEHTSDLRVFNDETCDAWSVDPTWAIDNPRWFEIFPNRAQLLAAFDQGRERIDADYYCQECLTMKSAPPILETDIMHGSVQRSEELIMGSNAPKFIEATLPLNGRIDLYSFYRCFNFRFRIISQVKGLLDVLRCSIFDLFSSQALTRDEIDWESPEFKERLDLMEALQRVKNTVSVCHSLEYDLKLYDSPMNALRKYSIVPVRLEDIEENDAKDCFCGTPFGEEVFGKVEYPVRTPCNHVFGHICLVNWLTRFADRDACPSCRTELEVGAEHSPQPWLVHLQALVQRFLIK